MMATIEHLKSVGFRCPERIFNSDFAQNLRLLIQERGFESVFLNSDEAHTKIEYFGMLFRHTNGVVWRYFHSPHQNYTAGQTNLLFIDDGMFCPEKFLYIDRFGFGGASSIVIFEENKRDLSPDEQMEVHRIIDEQHGLYTGRNKSGPIVVAVYTESEIIHSCHEMLPTNVPVVFIRPPSLKARFDRIMELYLKKNKHWSVMPNEAYKQTISQSRSLVTNLDKMAFYALSKGIPTATLGRGLWSGASCTLECQGRPRLLKTITAYDFDYLATDRYLAAILRKQIEINGKIDDLRRNAEISSWQSRFSEK